MNKVTYNRWKDFAIRMSKKGWCPREIMRTEHQRTVISAVEDFFAHIEGDYNRDVIRLESWDDTRTDYRNAEQFPWGWRGNYGPYVCDIVSEFLSNYNPFYWDCEEWDEAYEAWEDEWGGRIRSCIRAGLDLASQPSAGVVGFTRGDIERMYPAGVPQWIRKGWGKQNGEWRPINWDDIPHESHLWA